jgi:hypothetical protein
VLNGTATTYEIRELEAQQLKYQGTDSDFSLDSVRAAVNAQLTGGEADLTSVTGNLTLTALESARVTAERHDGKMSLTLKEDSTAELEEVTGDLTAMVIDSEMEAYAVDGLDLIAQNARVSAEVLKRLTKLKIKLSEIELDLRRITDRRLTVSVVDQSYVTVLLDAPCRVQVRETEDGGSGLSVSGCELQMERSGRWKGQRRKTADGRRPFLLIAKVSLDGDLRIQGSP